MKKTSIKNLEVLKKKGWEISNEDIKEVKTTHAASETKEAVTNIGVALKELSDSIKESVRINTNHIDQVMQYNNDVLKGVLDLFKEHINQPKPNWEADVRRNKEGFIQKIFLKSV